MSNEASQSNRRRRGPMGGGPIGAVEKPKDFKGTLGKMFRYMGRYKFAVLLVVIFAVGSTIFSIIGPKILGNATTELFNGLISKVSGGSGINFDEIARILLWLIGLYAVSSLYPGYHHDPSHPKNYLSPTPRYGGKNQPSTHEVFRLQTAR